MKLKNNLILYLLIIFTGCENIKPDPTPHINDMGIVVFLIFGMVIILTLLLQHIQKTKFLERFREKVRAPTIVLAVCQQVLGIWFVFLFFRSTEVKFLYSLVGGILIVCGFFLRRWAVTRSPGQSVDLKIVTIGWSFIITLLWLIHYAADMINF